MRKNVFIPVAAGVLLCVSAVAQAAPPAQTTFQVSATVNANCLVAAEAMNFGNYVGDADLNATSAIRVRCSSLTPYEVSLNEGGSGDFASRRLAGSGSNQLEYNLYVADPSSSTAPIWGDTSGGTEVVSGVGQGMSINNANTHTVYGLLPNSTANQNAPTGVYTDTIQVTVTY